MENYKPQIWIGCLAAYNSGYLHGEWIDCIKGTGHIEDEIQRILKSSPVAEECEEWEIFDTIDLGDLSGCNDLVEIHERAKLIAEYGEVAFLLFKEYEHAIDVARALEDCYIGEYESVLDYAYEYVEECLDLGDGIAAQYFDYKSFAHDLEIDCLIVLKNSNHNLYLFHKH